MTQNNQKNIMPWDQREFEKLKATWSPLRRLRDKWKLREIFNHAADSPTLKQALDWANTHGIKIFVDRTDSNNFGYYNDGTGVVALTQMAFIFPTRAISTLVHEIRHAWQDYHHLLPAPGTDWDFSEDFIKTALIEADAEAFGCRAEEEFQVAQLKKDGGHLTPSQQHVQKNEISHLRKNFLGWFSDPDMTLSYADSHLLRHSQHWGISLGKRSQLSAEAGGQYEFKSSVARMEKGIDITDLDDVLRLGENFSGINYLKKLPRDLLPRKILSPSLAASFYNAANDNEKKLVTTFRKRRLKEKLAVALQKKSQGMHP